MRYFLFIALLLVALPALAQDNGGDAQGPVRFDGVMRGDAGLYQAEDLLQNKKYSEALTVLDQVIARNIRTTDAHVDSAVAWLKLGNTERAKASITTALAIDKGHMGAYVIGGWIAMTEKNPQQAEYYLGALRVLCRGESCPEFKILQRVIREAPNQ